MPRSKRQRFRRKTARTDSTAQTPLRQDARYWIAYVGRALQSHWLPRTAIGLIGIGIVSAVLGAMIVSVFADAKPMAYIRHGLALLTDLLWSIGAGLGAAVALLAMRTLRDIKGRPAGLVLGLLLLGLGTFGGALVQQAVNEFGVRYGPDESIAILGLYSPTADGSLGEDIDSEQFSSTLVAALASALDEHRCGRGEWSVLRAPIPRLFLLQNTAASLPEYLRRSPPVGAHLALWGLLDSSRRIVAFNTTAIDTGNDAHFETSARLVDDVMVRIYNAPFISRATVLAAYAYVVAGYVGQSDAWSKLKKTGIGEPLECLADTERLHLKATSMLDGLGVEAESAELSKAFTLTTRINRGMLQQEAGLSQDALESFASAALVNPYFPLVSRDEYMNWAAELVNSSQTDESDTSAFREFGTGAPLLVKIKHLVVELDSDDGQAVFDRMLAAHPDDPMVIMESAHADVLRMWKHIWPHSREPNFGNHGWGRYLTAQQRDLLDRAVAKYQLVSQLLPEWWVIRSKLAASAGTVAQLAEDVTPEMVENMKAQLAAYDEARRRAGLRPKQH